MLGFILILGLVLFALVGLFRLFSPLIGYFIVRNMILEEQKNQKPQRPQMTEREYELKLAYEASKAADLL